MHSIAAVFKEKRQTKNSLTIKADFIVRVPSSTRERPYMKNRGRRSYVYSNIYTTSRIGKKQQHVHSIMLIIFGGLNVGDLV